MLHSPPRMEEKLEPIVDSHAHVTLCAEYLGAEDFDRDCAQNGVAWVLDAGIHPRDFAARKKALGPEAGLATKFYLGVALAPHEVEAADGAALAEVERILREENPAAISEIGLEYAQLPQHKGRQKEIFSAQLQMALRSGKPVFLHIREAFDDAAALVKESGVRRGAVHCFSGSPAEARLFLELGFHLSFSGIVTFKNARAVQDAAVYCPLDRLLTETDAPWLAPAPFRGQKNRSSWVRHTNEQLARLRGMDAREMNRALRRNAEGLLKIP